MQTSVLRPEPSTDRSGLNTPVGPRFDTLTAKDAASVAPMQRRNECRGAGRIELGVPGWNPGGRSQRGRRGRQRMHPYSSVAGLT